MRIIRYSFINEGPDRRRDRLTMETFYYDEIYNILQETTIQKSTSRKLKKLKDSIVGLHHTQEQRILLDTDEPDRIAKEGPSLYHIVILRKRQEARIIHNIHEIYGNLQTKSTDILRTFTDLMRRKYDYIQVDEDCVIRMANTLNKTLPHAANIVLYARHNERNSSRCKKRETTQCTWQRRNMSRALQINIGDVQTRHVGSSETNALERDNTGTTDTRNTSMFAKDAYT